MSYAVGQMEKLFQSYSRNGKCIYYYGYMIVLFQCNTNGSTVELHYPDINYSELFLISQHSI